MTSTSAPRPNFAEGASDAHEATPNEINPRAYAKPHRVDWATVRREFESTECSVRELARRHGVKSENSIRKHIKAGCWKRAVAMIDEHLVEEGAALSYSHRRREMCGAAEPAHRWQSEAKSIFVELENDVRTGTYQSSAVDAERQDMHLPPLDEPPVRRPSSVSSGVRTLRPMADLHAEAIGEQVDAARLTRSTGTAVLECIHEIMRHPPGSKACKQALARLKSFGPDRETLSNLMKSASVLVEAGTRAERRALHMDKATPPAPSEPTKNESQGLHKFNAMLKLLPLDVMMKLRQVVLEMSRLPPTA